MAATLTNVTFAHNRAVLDDATSTGGLGRAIYSGEAMTLHNTLLAYNASGNQWGLHQTCAGQAPFCGGLHLGLQTVLLF
jgi:hypothetical protein